MLPPLPWIFKCIDQKVVEVVEVCAHFAMLISYFPLSLLANKALPLTPESFPQ